MALFSKMNLLLESHNEMLLYGIWKKHLQRMKYEYVKAMRAMHQR